MVVGFDFCLLERYCSMACLGEGLLLLTCFGPSVVGLLSCVLFLWCLNQL